MKCSKCGKKNAWQSEFCSGCGTPLEPPPPGPASAPGTGPESWKWIGIWMLVVVIIIVGFCFYAFLPEGHFRGARSDAVLSKATARERP